MANININRNEIDLGNFLNDSLWDLPSPSSMSYFWNFGSILGFCLATQVLSGFLLSLHYTSYAPESFYSVVNIITEIWNGWLIRLIHINGASMFFLLIYLHLFRGIFYISAQHNNVWNSGVSILIIMIAISFLGYVLPWGQISYWAVAVITNLFSVAPLIGEDLVKWIWGGFSVSAPTLTRFYSLHFILPFVLSALVILHLIFLHNEGSSNSVGINSNIDNIPFHPYFSVNDLSFLVGMLILFVILISFYPYVAGDPVNNIPANAMQTPVHIQPEWYFLPSYAILRSLPSNTAGVLALLISVIIFYTISIFKINFSTNFSNIRLFFFWIIISSFLFLINIGSLPAEEPYIFMSNLGSLTYFVSIITLNI